MNKKFKYGILKGNFTESGEGDFWGEGVFDTLEEAQNHMYEICYDTNGISKYHNGYLETLIEVNEFEGDSVVNYDIIDSIKYKY